MTNWITPEIVDLIMEAKTKWPKAFKLQTIETEGYLILNINARHFEDFNIYDKIRIAEGVNELCEKIRKTGCPTFIQKV